MKYATTYDIGERKRKKGGINEDSIAVTLLQDGHRDGLDVDLDSRPSESTDAQSIHGPGDEREDDDDVTADSNESDGVAESDGSLEINEETTAVYPTDGKIASASDPVESASPQDRYAAIVVLADGAGGEQAGDLASYIATTVITEELSGFVHRARRLETGGFGLEVDSEVFGEAPSDAEVESKIEDAVEAANEAIIRYTAETNLGGMYSTVVAGVYLGEKFHYGWVGDSRAYVVNEAHGEISLLTKDHAKVQRYEDEGKIDEIESKVHPEGNKIDRAVGGRPETDLESAQIGVETRTIPLFREDIVVLTSDGLIDAQTDAKELYHDYVKSDRDDDVGERVLEEVVTDADIRDIVLEEPTLRAAAERFVEFANDKGGKDNISLILLSGSVLPESPDASDSSLPERALDPDTPLEERTTVIKKK